MHAAAAVAVFPQRLQAESLNGSGRRSFTTASAEIAQDLGEKKIIAAVELDLFTTLGFGSNRMPTSQTRDHCVMLRNDHAADAWSNQGKQTTF